MRLNYAVRAAHLEWVLLALTSDHSAGPALLGSSSETIENKNCYSVLLSLNDVEDVCHSLASWVKAGEPNWKWGAHLEMG